MDSTRARRIVLFSGGSASRFLAQALDSTSAEIINVIAVFDNGGSTGALRRASSIPMPAMGDIRKRLVDLAPAATPLQSAVKKLFDMRFSERKAEYQLRSELSSLIDAVHPLMLELSEEVRSQTIATLRAAVRSLPSDFPLRELSLGNLLLFGHTLQSGSFMAAVEWAREALAVKSRVLPVTLQSAHLGALCEHGHWVLGQAALTSEDFSLPGRVECLHFLEREDSFAFQPSVHVNPAVADYLESADAFILGFGSFLTSVLPHLLVKGVGSAFVRRSIPKFLLCNPTLDKETAKFTVRELVDALSFYALADEEAAHDDRPVVTHVLHFGSDPLARVPPGQMSDFPGAYLDLGEVKGYERMGDRSREIVFSTLHVPDGRTQEAAPRTDHSVVLFDLDATLFDYTQLRIDATRVALEGLVSDPRGISADLMDLLRPPLTEILENLGLRNLRREWDSTEVLACGILLDKPETRKAFLSLARTAKTFAYSEDDISFSKRLETQAHAFKLRNSVAASSLIASISRVMGNDKALRSGRDRFRDYVGSNARLYAGAKEVIAALLNLGAQVHVVSEGDSAVQMFKFNSLGLGELVETCIVTDITCGIAPVLAELFAFCKEQKKPSAVLVRLYDELAPYCIKSTAFFTKLVHSLMEGTAADLRDRMQTPRFLTAREWQSVHFPNIMMVGDRYKKDVEPLLTICPGAAHAYRVLTGRYYSEDPLHELIDGGRPMPSGVFSDLPAMLATLTAAVKEHGKPMARPAPSLPAPVTIDQALSECSGLSAAARATLADLKAEALRQSGDSQ
jgi:2-phospho-L-lactate transferase/gluconeogenesis factor (CofD/UPF0052 family)/phosphoglycolate phosphatase-like HAD superfamily hydrolase